MININLIFKKKKWFKFYKNKINNNCEYLNYNILDIYGYKGNVNLNCVVLYDTVNNIEFTKLVKKIYKLKKNSSFKVDIYYIKKKIFAQTNYIKPQFDCTGVSTLAEIDLLDDTFLKKIEITFTQINNEDALIAYNCYFNKPLKKIKDINEIIIKEYKSLNKIKYSSFYIDVDRYKDEINENIDLQLKYFREILQYRIQKLFFSHYIKKYLIPIKYNCFFNKKTSQISKNLKNPFLIKAFTYNDNKYLLLNMLEEHQGSEIHDLIFENSSNYFNIINNASKLKMQVYYNLFYQIEKYELESKVAKYLNSYKFLIDFWNYKWLINKLRKIDEPRFYKINNEFDSEVKYYDDNKKIFFSDSLVNSIKDVYEGYITHIQNLNALNYNIITFLLSITAIIIAVVALFI